MTGPLDGYRVLDLTGMIAGPMATMVLADQGADVIKVERPDGGDHVRKGAAQRGGFAANFLNANRNKRSIAIDLKRPDGVAALKRIAATVDVVVQNFRPGVVDRLGIGEADIRAVKPDVVYVSISGFGETGPYRDKPTYDPIVQAVSGLASIQGGSDKARPRLVRTIVPDKVTALTAAQAITAALLARERTGEGQHVRLSMLEAVLQFLWPSDMTSQTFADEAPGEQRAASFIDLIYETANGHMSVAVMSDREWAGLVRALERPEWLEDPRFRTPALRDRNIDDRLALTQEVLRTRTTAEWLARLEAVNVPCAPVVTRNGLLTHPQVEALGSVVEFDHPQAGRLRQMRPAARFAKTPAAIRTGAPVLGADGADVLAEAGFAGEEVAALVAAGTVALPDGDARVGPTKSAAPAAGG